jgi:hypothetical protein
MAQSRRGAPMSVSEWVGRSVAKGTDSTYIAYRITSGVYSLVNSIQLSSTIVDLLQDPTTLTISALIVPSLFGTIVDSSLNRTAPTVYERFVHPQMLMTTDLVCQ